MSNTDNRTPGSRHSAPTRPKKHHAAAAAHITQVVLTLLLAVALSSPLLLAARPLVAFAEEPGSPAPAPAPAPVAPATNADAAPVSAAARPQPQANVASNKPLVNGASYYIRPANSSLYYLDVYGTSSASTANIGLWEFHGGTSQRFTARYNHAQGFYWLYTHTGVDLTVDLANADVPNGTNIWQYIYNGTAAQWWVIKSTPYYPGAVNIIPWIRRDAAMEVGGVTPGNGANVQIWDLHSDWSHQAWFFERIRKAPTLAEKATSVRDQQATVRFGSDLAGTYYWQLDGSAPADQQALIKSGSHKTALKLGDNSVVLPNLRPGKHTLYITGQEPGGEPGNNLLAVSFTVQPPTYTVSIPTSVQLRADDYSPVDTEVRVVSASDLGGRQITVSLPGSVVDGNGDFALGNGYDQVVCNLQGLGSYSGGRWTAAFSAPGAVPLRLQVQAGQWSAPLTSGTYSATLTYTVQLTP